MRKIATYYDVSDQLVRRVLADPRARELMDQSRRAAEHELVGLLPKANATMSELLDDKDSTVRYKAASRMLEFVSPPKGSGNEVNVNMSVGDSGRQKLLNRIRDDPDVRENADHSANGQSDESDT